METKIFESVYMLSYALKLQEAKTLLSISPLTVTDLTSQRPRRNTYFLFRQIVSDLSIVFTDWGRRLAHMYGNTIYITTVTFPAMGTDYYFRKKKKKRFP